MPLPHLQPQPLSVPNLAFVFVSSRSCTASRETVNTSSGRTAETRSQSQLGCSEPAPWWAHTHNERERRFTSTQVSVRAPSNSTMARAARVLHRSQVLGAALATLGSAVDVGAAGASATASGAGGGGGDSSRSDGGSSGGGYSASSETSDIWQKKKKINKKGWKKKKRLSN